ncbi:hypothetical protein PFISCL1PPCAC_15421 [Pristionchus fissidentatus]|uniref:PUB domain-containing protein n=1 Tax=Pristionchus fissidentatus TaxID=1538716 RepID=A0AAV5VWZ8_9BILA|nr:hypothetical protein PFISCL1PPCAC_15421 [Pristionchus fissidentatus]
MDMLKKFVKGKKVDRHFKRTGPGAKLSDGASSSQPSVVSGSMQGSRDEDRVHASDVAAQAALKRMLGNEPTVSSSQKKIQMMAQRELEQERRERESASAKFSDDIKNLRVGETTVHELDHSNAISSVKFTCELLGDEMALPKDQLRSYLESYLRDEMEEEGVVPATLMITSLNQTEQRKIAMETIRKYLQNILENQSEPKFRKIRMSNKAFQDRVFSVKGGREFLEAVGFEEKEETNPEGIKEMYLLMSESAALDDARLIQALELLDGATPLALKVARDTKTFTLKDGEKISSPKLPSDFFNITGEELKKEQERMTVQVDRMTTMRTREMREKDSKQAEYRYKYSLVRVRTADKCLVQGVFSVGETLLAVRQWLHSLLSQPEAQFDMKDAAIGTFKDETKSLAELGLVPAVTLHLDMKQDVNLPILSEEVMREAVPFSIE